jgi:hypothetical protein
MFMKKWLRKLATVLSAAALLMTFTPASFGQAALGQPCCGQSQCCEPGCKLWDCPPCIKYCAEGGPRICVLCGCPKPICCPSDAPNWGYFQTCWRPYPWGPNWSHCYGVPPAATVVPPPLASSNNIHSMPLQPGAELPGQPSLPRSAAPPATMPR